jgi:hypothetical protein
LVLGNGKFRTHSLRGLLWAGSFAGVVLVIAALVIVVWSMLYLTRPLQARDAAFLLFAVSFGWFFSVEVIRPYVWLVDDRIVPASGALVAWREKPAQLEMFKEEDHRTLGLVRYTAVCLVCAAEVELGYGYGDNRRRLFGRCVESPQEHVYTFDRITRQGQRRGPL